VRGGGPWAAAVAAGALVAAGCAPRFAMPLKVSEPRDPAPLLAALRSYNSGPEAVRLQGKFRAQGKGSVEFGASAAEGVGLRLDAVAGPFGTPVLAMACAAEDDCRAYVPARQVVYVDEGATWGWLLATLLRGRVPLVGTPAGAWEAAAGTSVLLLRNRDGWEERVEWKGGAPDRVFLGRRGEAPLLRVSYAEYGPEVAGHPFPRRLELEVRRPAQGYEITIRQVEPATAIDPDTFQLAIPPGTREENSRGRATWNEMGIPLWLPGPSRPEGAPEGS